MEKMSWNTNKKITTKNSQWKQLYWFQNERVKNYDAATFVN